MRSASSRPRAATRRGLARRDIIVTGVVAALFLALAALGLLQMRGMTRRLHCEQRQALLARAALAHESELGHFPGYRNLQAIDARDRRRAASWIFPLFPYDAFDEAGSFYADIHAQFGPGGPDAARGQPPDVWIEDLICPDDLPHKRKGDAPWLSFVANCGMPDAPNPGEFPPDWPANGVFLDRFLDPPPPGNQVTLAFIQEHDGAEATLLLSENLDARHWTDTAEALIGFVWIDSIGDGRPAPDERLLPINRLAGKGDGSIRFARPSSGHAQGVNVAYCSGATRFLSEQIDYVVFTQMMTPAGDLTRRPGTDEPAHPARTRARRPTSRRGSSPSRGA